MNRQEQLSIYEKMDQETIAIAIKKGQDYANEDVLSNFKSVSEVIKLLGIDTKTPEGYAMLLVLLKIARIANLKSKGVAPQNESLLDSYQDGINYFKLAFCCEIDSTAKKLEETDNDTKVPYPVNEN